MQIDIETIARCARSASSKIALLSTDLKNRILREIADIIELNVDAIHCANEQDLADAKAAGLPDAKVRRLVLTPSAIAQMSEGLRQVAELPDPVGEITRNRTVQSGLVVKRVRCPIGVIMMIYEARPNVTVDAFALCFKSGNACILKGGKEARHSNRALADLIVTVLRRNEVPAEAITLITSSDREEMKALLKLSDDIDLVIPRGGTELIKFVHAHSRIPMVQHFQGVCHIFVDESADQNTAIDICATAKTSAPSACNAVETILVHGAIAETFVPKLAERFKIDGVEIRGDSEVCRLAPSAVSATDDDWDREYLDLIVAMKVVQDIDAGIAHIKRHTSNHTEAILSRNDTNQKRFVDEIQSSCVFVNASTRFNDGFQLGLGAEIGISTSKIHAYGPMGLEELTTQRYVVMGEGQYR